MTDASGNQPTLKIRLGGLFDTQQPFPYTYEEQFIIRMPPTVATELREELREHDQPDDLSITFSDTRRAKVSFHGRKYLGVLLDLPSIIESQRTFDRSQYYKIADICQMLLVLPDTAESQKMIVAFEKNGWQSADGLTPPLRNVRERRFRKTMSYGHAKEMEAIEKKVQALLDKDSACISSSFTLFDASGNAILTGGGKDGKFRKPLPGEIQGASLSQLIEEDEDEDDEEFAAELEEAMLAEEQEAEQEQAPPSETQTSILETGASQPLDSVKTESSQYSTAITELQLKINERKGQLESVTNPMIKARLEDVIRQLENDLQSRLH